MLGDNIFETEPGCCWISGRLAKAGTDANVMWPSQDMVNKMSERPAKWTSGREWKERGVASNSSTHIITNHKTHVPIVACIENSAPAWRKGAQHICVGSSGRCPFISGYKHIPTPCAKDVDARLCERARTSWWMVSRSAVRRTVCALASGVINAWAATHYIRVHTLMVRGDSGYCR